MSVPVPQLVFIFQDILDLDVRAYAGALLDSERDLDGAFLACAELVEFPEDVSTGDRAVDRLCGNEFELLRPGAQQLHHPGDIGAAVDDVQIERGDLTRPEATVATGHGHLQHRPGVDQAGQGVSRAGYV